MPENSTALDNIVVIQLGSNNMAVSESQGGAYLVKLDSSNSAQQWYRIDNANTCAFINVETGNSLLATNPVTTGPWDGQTFPWNMQNTGTYSMIWNANQLDQCLTIPDEGNILQLVLAEGQPPDGATMWAAFNLSQMTTPALRNHPRPTNSTAPVNIVVIRSGILNDVVVTDQGFAVLGWRDPSNSTLNQQWYRIDNANTCAFINVETLQALAPTSPVSTVPWDGQTFPWNVQNGGTYSTILSADQVGQCLTGGIVGDDAAPLHLIAWNGGGEQLWSAYNLSQMTAPQTYPVVVLSTSSALLCIVPDEEGLTYVQTAPEGAPLGSDGTKWILTEWASGVVSFTYPGDNNFLFWQGNNNQMQTTNLGMSPNAAFTFAGPVQEIGGFAIRPWSTPTQNWNAWGGAIPMSGAKVGTWSWADDPVTFNEAWNLVRTGDGAQMVGIDVNGWPVFFKF